jgi:predicted aspartyl protease
MGRVSMPYAGDEGPQFPVLIGLDGDRVTALLEAGDAVPPPVFATATFDTGTNITVIPRALVAKLGLLPVGQRSSQTAGGVVAAELFLIGFGFPPLFGLAETTVLEERLLVAVLPGLPDDAPVLFGMDLLNRCRLTIDGPARTFALEF